MATKNRRDILLLILAVVLFAVLMNFSFLLSLSKRFFTLIFPIILGLIFALILNAPMRCFEKIFDKCFSRMKKKPSVKIKYSVSLLLSVLSIFLVFVIVFTMAIPKLLESVKGLIVLIDEKIPDFLLFIEKYGFDTSTVTDKIAEFDVEKVIKNLTQGALSVFSTAVDATKIAVKFFTTAVFSFIVAIYLLLDKNNVSRQFKKLCYAFLPSGKVDSLYKTAYLVRDTFTKFLSGQCLEALILGVLIFILFSIFSLPYASLIAVMAAVLSFVPYIGSFVALVVGTFLILISDPKKALICVIVYLVAQFIEQHFIYPHVVGNSVGLSPFYTIVAALLGGQLFGVFGMVFFIPLFSVVFALIRDYSNYKVIKNEKSNDL